MQPDKLAHAQAGAVVYLLLAPHVGHHAAFAAVIVVAALKELYDLCATLRAQRQHRLSPRTAEIADMLATIAGGWVALAASAALYEARAAGVWP